MKKISIILLFSLLFSILYSQIIEDPGIAKINQAMCIDVTPENVLHPSEKLIINSESRNSSILYVNAQNNADPFFKASVASLPNVDSFVEFDAYSATPSVAYLLDFDVVIVASNYVFADPITLGNNLASYVDQGGSVCMLEGSFSSGFALQGLIMDPTYSPFTVASYTLVTVSCSNFVTHPITTNVSYIETGLYTFSSLQGNGVSLGVYGSGDHVAAYNPDKAIVAINVFPADGFWGGDFIQMISNTIDWFTLPPEISVTPSSMDEYLNFGETATQILTIENIGVAGAPDLDAFITIETSAEDYFQSFLDFPQYEQREHIAVERTTTEITNGYPDKFQQLTEQLDNRSVIFSDDMESGVGGWTTQVYGVDDLWHQTNLSFNSPVTSWWCGIEAQGNYQTANTISTALISPPIDLTTISMPVGLYFYEFYETEGGYDYCMVDVTTDGGSNWTPLRGGYGSAPSGYSGGWIFTALDLTPFLGNMLQIRFYFDTGDAYVNEYPGWFVDDVIVTTGNPLVPWLSVDTYNVTIPAESSADVNVDFDASGIFGGTYTANIVIDSNDPITPQVIVPITLEVTGIPDIETDVTSIDFGTLPYPASTDAGLLVLNTGTDWLNVTDIVSDNPDFTVDITSFSLYAMEQQGIIVTFTPSSAGTITGDLTIYSNDPDEPELVIALSGACTAAEIVVDPTSMSENLFVGETADQILTIQNVGELELTYSTGINFLTDRDNIPRPNYLPYNDNYPRRKDVEPSAEIDMSNVRYEKSFEEPSIDILRGSIAWFKAGEYSTYFYGIFDTDTPGDMTELLSPPAWNAYCGDFDTINTDFFYVNNPDDNNTYVVDCATGAAILVGPTGLTAFLNGMACDKTEGTMYAVNSTDLYTIDLSTGAANLVGPIGNTGGLMLTLACDGDGELWGIDLIFDTLWNIDKDTGAGTEIGPVGFDCGYAQSMSWDPETDIVFWAAYGGGLDGNLRIVDTTTGATTLVGDFEGGREVTVLAFPGVGEVEEWLSITNNGSGVVPSGGGSVGVTIHFDATNLLGGTYQAELVVSSNDPDEPEVIVPVTLDVTGIPDIMVDPLSIDYGAHFVGATIEEILTISSTGTDDLEITDITSDNPDFYVDVTTYTISPDHSEEVIVYFNPSTVGVITGVLTVHSNDPNDPEVYIDLTGEGLDAPEIVITPTSFDVNIAPDVIVDNTLTIENTGVVDVNYNISIEYMIPTDRVRNYGDYADRSTESSSEIDLSNRMNTFRHNNLSDNRAAGDVLGTYTGMPGSNLGMVWVGDLLYVVDYNVSQLAVYDISTQTVIAAYSIHTMPFGITWDGYYLWIGDWVGNVYAYNLDGSSAGYSFSCPDYHYPALTWDGSYFIIAPAWSMTNIYRVDETGAIIDTYTNAAAPLDGVCWAPEHTNGHIWATTDNLNISQINLNDGTGEAEVISSFAWPEFDQMSYAISHHNFNLWWGDWDGPLYEIDDGLAEINWLTIDITSGTLGTGESDDITVTIDANEVDSLGVYEASLIIVSNDPDDPVIYVPVTLTVNYPPEIVLPDDFTFEEDSSLMVDFDQYITDPNSSPYELSVTGNTNVTVDIVGSEVTFGAAPDWYGTETLTFTVDDGQTDSDVVDIIVLPVNDDPTIVLPDDFTFDEDEELIVDFSAFVYDVDPDDLTLSVTGNIEITVDIVGFEVTFGATENWNGTETLTFIVDDNQGDRSSFTVGKKITREIESNNNVNSRATAEDDVEVIVTPVNDEPVLIGFLPEELEFTVVEDSTVTFSVDIEDIDSTIDYEWFVNDVLQTESTEEFVHIFEVVGDIEIKSVASDEEYEIVTVWTVEVEPGIGAGSELLPVITVLSKNYPNPFNPTTTIKFDIKENETGDLSIYNMKGQLVFTKSFGAGHHNFLWDATSCSSGIYFFRLTTPSYSHSRKMIILK